MIAMVLLALGIIAVSRLRVFADVAVLFWLAGFSMLVGAGIIALHVGRGQRPPRWTGSVVVAVAAALVACGLATATISARPPTVPDSLVLPSSAVGLVATRISAPDTTVTPDLSEGAVSDLVSEIAATQSELGAVSDSHAQDVLATVRAAGFVPASGLRADDTSATVHTIDATTLVTVPLIGTDLPEVSCVTFSIVGDDVAIVEMAARWRVTMPWPSGCGPTAFSSRT
ncbi:hypothetical protein [Cellulomonas sp. RIT-PI-Y]|uniref:hypothetical protein n=1 Tax=Cellulomonas sp. RIT-PI-Y TaxID=3035297 RepID=UPI0021D95450|nr:hypothetical protein [Cellulomonas sp. RIT-PI-Y]